jgi:GTPase
VIEAGRWGDDDLRALAAITQAGVPCVLVINKVDRLKDKAPLLPFIERLSREHDFRAIFPLSAQKGIGVQDFRRGLLALLPEGEAQYAEDEVTDRSERFLAAELIREQLMRQLGDELPYAATVEIEQFREEGRLLRISAVIWVEREGQKAIVVGAGGAQMRAIGQGARIGIEKLLDRKVFLQLWCKVRENWSDDEAQLKRFGYAE